MIKSLVIVLMANGASGFWGHQVQWAVNSHYGVSGPAAALFFALAIAAAALALRSFRKEHGLPTVLMYTLLSASFAGWASHVLSMVCQGCQQSG
jgi:hypothetical protein